MKNQILLNQFKEALKQEGLKLTPQRRAVLEEIVQNNKHRECEEIYRAINKKQKNVSLATVYRTLNVLVENNFARKMDLGDGRYVFESKVDSPHHDHMICVSCGDIIEFISEEIELIQARIAKKHKFIMQKHLHQLFGICKKCQ
tara:strand:+ start:238 stop:669 length:432 start_codon:yes stop_codon:yes gene_type:complete